MEIDTEISYIKDKVLTIVSNNGMTNKSHKMIHTMSHTSVICNHCGSVYDLKKVEVKHRYSDCTEFITPCCNYEHADDITFKLYH